MTFPKQLTTALAGRYDVEREIGRGGMATVYLARDIKHDRAVALKLLNPELGAVLGAERFLSEIRVTANLQHPNLLPLFDSGESDGLLFYVMPFVAGESLRARLDREKQLPVDEALRIATAIASALDYAHRNNVVHRDLKPENILLQDGQPVIADFGIALAVSAAGGVRVTQTGLSLGTPQYMSPEQATGDRLVDGRSDIYSLAAVTYEMLAGEPPHLGNTVQAIVAKVLTERPADIRLRRPAVGVNTSAAIARGLEKLAADRFNTAQEFADALNGRGFATAVPSSLAARWTRRASSAVIGVAVLACAAAIVAGIGWRNATQAPVEPVQFALTLEAGERPFTSAFGKTVAIAPDGKTIGYLAAGAGGVRRLYVRGLNDFRGRPLPGTELAMQPFFSPDGVWLGFLSGTQLRKVPLSGGPATAIAEVGPTVSGMAWGKRGGIVTSVNGRLALIAVGGGVPRPLPSQDSSTMNVGVSQRFPVWLEDGQTVLFTKWNGSIGASRLAVMSIRTGAVTEVGVFGSSPLGVIDDRLIYEDASGGLMAIRFDRRQRRVVGDAVPVIDSVFNPGGGGGAVNAALSDNGSLAYVRGSSLTEAVLADEHGTRPLITGRHHFAFPRYSPDARHIAFTMDSPSGRDVWVFEVASGALVKLTTAGSLNERPEWTADSKRVVFRSNRGGRSEIWSQPIDASGPASKVFGDATAEIWEGLLTADGNTLIYRTGTSGASNIWYRNLRGDTTRKAVAATANEWEPRLSPDGRWVAYASKESGSFQIYVRAFPVEGPRTQVSIDGGTTPLWSRDGTRIFYINGDEVRTATVSTTGGFKVLAREQLLAGGYVNQPGHANYDVAPDGKHVLLLKTGAEDAHIVVIWGWKSALRAADQARSRSLSK